MACSLAAEGVMVGVWAVWAESTGEASPRSSTTTTATTTVMSIATTTVEGAGRAAEEATMVVADGRVRKCSAWLLDHLCASIESACMVICDGLSHDDVFCEPTVVLEKL